LLVDDDELLEPLSLELLEPEGSFDDESELLLELLLEPPPEEPERLSVR
jgi:hypothetical protein